MAAAVGWVGGKHMIPRRKHGHLPNTLAVVPSKLRKTILIMNLLYQNYRVLALCSSIIVSSFTCIIIGVGHSLIVDDESWESLTNFCKK